jgi:hypothetical protein
LAPLPPQAWEALQHALARLAIDFASGPTSVKDCALLCKYHHLVLIHRHGWTFELLPDGSTRATSPDGATTLRSHNPPPAEQPSG